jgi:nucleotidyltransferase/DNA polymerase involved in DNA repair
MHHYLAKLPVEKVWGIRPNTTTFLQKHGIRTALEFVQRPEAWVKKYLSNPFFQIWQELNGHYVFELATGEHDMYYTMQRLKTCTPASRDRAFVFAQLAKNIENAYIKARKYKLPI